MGASSPVTKIWAWPVLPGVGEEELLPPPQAMKVNATSASIATTESDRFIRGAPFEVKGEPYGDYADGNTRSLRKFCDVRQVTSGQITTVISALGAAFGGWAQSLQTACPEQKPDAQAHWKLNPPRWPVTSKTSPMKNRPDTFRHSIVLGESSLVSIPPAVTSALAYPSVPEGTISQRWICFSISCRA